VHGLSVAHATEGNIKSSRSSASLRDLRTHCGRLPTTAPGLVCPLIWSSDSNSDITLDAFNDYGYGLAAISDAGANSFLTRTGNLDPKTGWRPVRDEWLGKSTQHQSLANQGMPSVKVKTFWAREPAPPERLLETLGEIIRHQIVGVTKRTMNIE